ncbi:unnamed protein product, partial [Pocillopora meandrina]
AYCSSLLFSGETSIVNFLRKAITLDEFQDAKIELLKFLQSYVMKMGKKINPYVVEIKVMLIIWKGTEAYRHCCKVEPNIATNRK